MTTKYVLFRIHNTQYVGEIIEGEAHHVYPEGNITRVTLVRLLHFKTDTSSSWAEYPYTIYYTISRHATTLKKIDILEEDSINLPAGFRLCN